MMNKFLLTTIALISVTGFVRAQEKRVPVTVDNFVRAESDLYLGAFVKKGWFGKFGYDRALPPIAAPHRVRTRDALRHYENFTQVNRFCCATSRGVQCHKRIVETGKN